MHHGLTAAHPPRTDDLDQRLVDLTQEYFRADPVRKDQIAAEFDALMSGDVLCLGTARRTVR